MNGAENAHGFYDQNAYGGTEPLPTRNGPGVPSEQYKRFLDLYQLGGYKHNSFDPLSSTGSQQATNGFQSMDIVERPQLAVVPQQFTNDFPSLNIVERPQFVMGPQQINCGYQSANTLATITNGAVRMSNGGFDGGVPRAPFVDLAPAPVQTVSSFPFAQCMPTPVASPSNTSCQSIQTPPTAITPSYFAPTAQPTLIAPPEGHLLPVQLTQICAAPESPAHLYQTQHTTFDFVGPTSGSMASGSKRTISRESHQHETAKQRRERETRIVVEQRRLKTPYKLIKGMFDYPISEGTLRGRWRNATKHRSLRPRVARWSDRQNRLLVDEVNRRMSEKPDDWDFAKKMSKIGWKGISEHLEAQAGYHFGYSTCKKRYCFLQGIDKEGNSLSAPASTTDQTTDD
ncbi:unnamed protein product [Periconia digitata]|uniref:Myb-like domain-containing protein n=1 Tax=Periconia digitata TaxID=1303443 RepID=A0A9W4XU68_9PLEO|nr:unnamed protein product [Periconia digitata]